MLTIWLARTTTTALLVGALLASACGDDDGDTAETGADDGASTTAPATGDETAATAAAEDTGCIAPQLHVTNQTGNAVEEFIMERCDSLDAYAYPVPPGGLPDGGELTIDLLGPGCWTLGYSGEGCSGDEAGMIDAACGETAEWTLTPENHVCAGI